jgi:peroxin-6
MEAFSLGEGITIDGTPSTNGDKTPTGSIRGRIKSLNKFSGGPSRSASGQSTTSSKGKGKSSKKGKGVRAAESDGSVDGDEEDMADGANEDDDDDYIVRTAHLANPMEEVE